MAFAHARRSRWCALLAAAWVVVHLPSAARSLDTVMLEASHGFAAGLGPGAYQQLQDALAGWGLPVTVSTADLTTVDLTAMAVVILSVDWLQGGPYAAAERDILTAFVDQGGSLLALGGATALDNAHLNPVTSAYGITCGLADADGAVLLITGHPVAAGLTGWDLGPAGVLGLGFGAGSVAHNAGAQDLIAAFDGGTPGHKVVVVGSPALRDAGWDALAERLVQNTLQWIGLTLVAGERTTWGGVRTLYR